MNYLYPALLIISLVGFFMSFMIQDPILSNFLTSLALILILKFGSSLKLTASEKSYDKEHN